MKIEIPDPNVYFQINRGEKVHEIALDILESVFKIQEINEQFQNEPEPQKSQQTYNALQDWLIEDTRIKLTLTEVYAISAGINNAAEEYKKKVAPQPSTSQYSELLQSPTTDAATSSSDSSWNKSERNVSLSDVPPPAPPPEKSSGG